MIDDQPMMNKLSDLRLETMPLPSRHLPAQKPFSRIPDNAGEQLRAALGLTADEPLALLALMDRSGSIFESNEIIAEYSKLTTDHIAKLEGNGTSVQITGFDGGYEGSHFYDMKQPNCDVDKAMLACGGGGTPTSDAIVHATEVLEKAPGKKVLLVVTDGLPMNASKDSDITTLESITKAQESGIEVVVVAFETQRNRNHLGPRSLTEYFGETWTLIKRYDETIPALFKSVGGDLDVSLVKPAPLTISHSANKGHFSGLNFDLIVEQDGTPIHAIRIGFKSLDELSILLESASFRTGPCFNGETLDVDDETTLTFFESWLIVDVKQDGNTAQYVIEMQARDWAQILLAVRQVTMRMSFKQSERQYWR